jgi:hypothetical protein
MAFYSSNVDTTPINHIANFYHNVIQSLFEPYNVLGGQVFVKSHLHRYNDRAHTASFSG